MKRISIPMVEAHLPELMPFINTLVKKTASRELADWPTMTESVRTFFTPAMMDKTDAALPGWKAMASYADGATSVHIISVLTALLSCPEFFEANPEQQSLMKWIVLFHDLAKVQRNGKRDFTHAFRSTALAGKCLPQLGFAVTAKFDTLIAGWASLTATALTNDSSGKEDIQDNRQLPAIVEGIKQLFGHNTPASLILKTVLLHMSIDVVSEWPQAAPLTQHENQQYVDVALWPLLRIMMLVDNDAWALFDPITRQRYRAETLAVFKNMRQFIN